jgi:hypothetical protein
MRRIAAGAVLALVLGATACTRQPDPDDGIASAQGAGANPTSAGASSSAGGVEDGVKLAKCLRDQGIPADDPPNGQGKPQVPESVPKAQVDAAYEQCRQFAPNYGKPAPPVDPAQLERLRKFAQCMRDQGVDWADPGPDGRPATPEAVPTNRGQPGATGTNEGPNMLDAAKVCSEKVPGTGITVEGGDGDGKKEEPTPR